MAKLTKKEFADFIGMKTGDLSNYIKRKKVNVVNDLVDTQDSVNIAFLNRHGDKGEPVEQIPREETFIEPKSYRVRAIPQDDIDLMDDIGDVPAFHLSEQKLKYLDTLKREREIALLQIKEDKLNGIVIPSDLMKPLFLQHNQSILTELKNMFDETLRSIAKLYSIPQDRAAAIKGEWTVGLNSSIRKAADMSVKGLDAIIAEYSVKRNVGERT